MNNAVMNKIDLLLESYLEEGGHFGSAVLDKRFAQNWPNSAQVRNTRSNVAKDILQHRAANRLERADGNNRIANIWDNVVRAYAHDQHHYKAYRKQYHVDPKNDLPDQRITEILGRSPHIISVLGGPGNDPKTPIHHEMAAKAGLYDKGMVPRDPEKSTFKFW